MSNRAVLTAALLMAVAGFWACWCDVAMLWDGAYQFCCSVTSGHAFIYLSRFHSWVVWQPVTWLAQCTGNLRVLKMAYGSPYCFAPLACVLLSWWIVRRRAPHLMIWPLFGAAIAPLPGQIFMINDSIFQMHLFWPLFLATFLPVSRAQLCAVVALSIFQLSHPIGVGLCFLCALGAVAFGRWGNPERRRALHGWAVWHIALGLGGIIKLAVWRDAYAAREATPGQLWMTFRWGVLWWPAAGLVAAWIAAGLLLWRGYRSDSARPRWAGQAVLPLLFITCVCWIYWAADMSLWQTAANYRRWLVPMSAPFLLAAGWELWRGARERREVAPPFERDRNRAGIAVSAVFLIVLGLQSYGWCRLFHRLTVQVAASPSTWIKESDLAWIRETPLDHWGLNSQVILVQGRTPRVLLWSFGDGIAAREEPARFALSPFNYFAPAAQPRNWFDWSTILRDTRAPLAP